MDQNSPEERTPTLLPPALRGLCCVCLSLPDVAHSVYSVSEEVKHVGGGGPLNGFMKDFLSFNFPKSQNLYQKEINAHQLSSAGGDDDDIL